MEQRCPKRHQENAISRRRFIFLGTAAAVAVAAGPLIELAPAPLGFDASAVDGILKDVYAPFIADQLNHRPYLLTHHTVKRLYLEFVEADRRYAGSLLES